MREIAEENIDKQLAKDSLRLIHKNNLEQLP